jgi:hypothetical protein
MKGVKRENKQGRKDKMKRTARGTKSRMRALLGTYVSQAGMSGGLTAGQAEGAGGGGGSGW